MVPHSFKIPIRPILLDSTALGSSRRQPLVFNLQGQPNLGFSNPAKPGKSSAIRLPQQRKKHHSVSTSVSPVPPCIAPPSSPSSPPTTSAHQPRDPRGCPDARPRSPGVSARSPILTFRAVRLPFYPRTKSHETPQSIHTDRTPCRHCNHRHPGRNAPARLGFPLITQATTPIAMAAG